MKLGKLIVVCGIDGAGKTTQQSHIVTFLQTKNRQCHVTKQPTTWYRNLPPVRDYLDKGRQVCTMETLALFAAADRMFQMDTEMNYYLSKGIDVVCDRYVYSSYAYFEARGVDLSFVRAINSQIREPDMGILLEINVTECIRRIERRDQGVQKFEEKDPSFLSLVQNKLREIWPSHFLRVDGTLPELEVWEIIQAYIVEKLDGLKEK